jgi:hypothetical protein
MITTEEAELVADEWVTAFSVDPYVVRQRDMTGWFKLDDLIHNRPEDALLVFGKLAQKDLINWTFEGVAAGPLRTFLMTYADRFDQELNAIGERNSAFIEMRAMAVEGL